MVYWLESVERISLLYSSRIVLLDVNRSDHASANVRDAYVDVRPCRFERMFVGPAPGDERSLR